MNRSISTTAERKLYHNLSFVSKKVTIVEWSCVVKPVNLQDVLTREDLQKDAVFMFNFCMFNSNAWLLYNL